jgi:hypothetical protein
MECGLMSQLGHPHHFDRAPKTSGLPAKADVSSVRRHSRANGKPRLQSIAAPAGQLLSQ